MKTESRNKTAMAFRLADDTIDMITAEAARTGKSKTSVVEDAIMWRRQFSDEAEAALHALARKHKLPERKVVEVALLKVSGYDGGLPFDVPAAA